MHKIVLAALHDVCTPPAFDLSEILLLCLECVYMVLPFVGMIKVKFALKQAPKTQRGSRGIALLILSLGARRWWVVSTTPRCFTPGKDPVPIVQEAGWAVGPVRTCAKNRWNNKHVLFLAHKLEFRFPSRCR
jgi:hypothetical protein